MRSPRDRRRMGSTMWLPWGGAARGQEVESMAWEACRRCRGKGTLGLRADPRDVGEHAAYVHCPDCEGMGRINTAQQESGDRRE